MFEYIKTWVELKTDRRAVTALEYALIAGVIVATILAGFQVLAGDLSTKFGAIGGACSRLTTTSDRLPSATAGPAAALIAFWHR